MSLAGTWIVTQHWRGSNPYKFAADFAKDGSITVKGGYFGMWVQLGTSSNVALAIANFKGETITAYAGNVVGHAMGGEMTGGASSGKTHAGTWSAVKKVYAKADQRKLKDPGQS